MTVENLLEGQVVAVEGAGIFRVLVDHRTIQIDSGEQALAARVSEQLRLEGQVGGRCCIATNRACGGGCIAANLELAAQQILHTAVVDGDQHQVRRLAADLEAEATSSHLDEGRSAPSAAFRLAGDNALTIAAADHEGSFFVCRYNRNAGSVRHDAERDGLGWDRFDFVDDAGCGTEPIHKFRAAGRSIALRNAKRES